MRKKSGKIVYSPTDLCKYMESEWVSWMDRCYLEFPGRFTPDPPTEIDKLLQRRGIEHERAFLESLRKQGYDVCDLSDTSAFSYASDPFAATVYAMRAGRDVIYQAALQDGVFAGYADFLIKVPGDSLLGSYHYEPWDTKLALHAKPYFLLQLSCYADMLRQHQGMLPENLVVVLGNQQRLSFPAEDEITFYSQMRDAFLRYQQKFDSQSPPEITGQEEFGRWKSHAQKTIQAQDHLCQVSNIRAMQIRKLHSAGIYTMTDLANTSLSGIPKMQKHTFEGLRSQAILQVASTNKPKFELIASHLSGKGLAVLPPKSANDVFFDMEGNPFAEGGDGLEYLFGATIIENGRMQYVDWWAHHEKEEKAAFEAFVDWAYERWQKDAAMHIYHYASYEKNALRRLMVKYETREKEMDALLCNEVFVDLYTIVRQSMRVGTPNYSLKSIELLYRDKRASEVSTAMDSVVAYQKWLDQRNSDGEHWQTSKVLSQIRAYNRDDCESTFRLAEWLRSIQNQQGICYEKKGHEILVAESSELIMSVALANFS